MLSKRIFNGLLYLIGIIAITLFGYLRLLSIASDTSQKLKIHLNESIIQVESYYQHEILHSLSKLNCHKFQNSANKFLFVTPDVRSVNIERNSVIVCSTISSIDKIKIDDGHITTHNHRIRLFYTDKTPFNIQLPKTKKGILVLKIKTNKTMSVAFGIHPEILLNILSNNVFFNVKIEFENTEFTSQGIVHLPHPTNQAKNALFTVLYETTPLSIFHYIVYNYGFVLLLWILIITIAATPIYNSITTFNSTYWKIKKALRHDQFFPYLQPVFNADGSLNGAEVLARWIHPSKGVIPSSLFIGEAEHNGQIKDITSQIMAKCIQGLKNVNIPQDGPFYLAINVCPIQFEDHQFLKECDLLLNAFANTQIHIVIELTERQEFTSNTLYVSSIEELKKRNIKISLDDFGTGHCSLKYLNQANIDILKIDKSYVATIDNGQNTNVLDGIIHLAKLADIPLIAEGVETTQQLDYLNIKKVESYQGYLLGYPIPITDFVSDYFTFKNNNMNFNPFKLETDTIENK